MESKLSKKTWILKRFPEFRKPIRVPIKWSKLATELFVEKYFKRKGVPGTGHEVSVEQVINRVVESICFVGKKLHYFNSRISQREFSNRLKSDLLCQRAFFNSPVWFNCGLYFKYKIKSDSFIFAKSLSNRPKITKFNNAYERPQTSACFIQGVEDSLDGIYSLLKNEAHLFKFGSGSGTNFSRIRSKYDDILGGGKSSGLIAFLDVFDRSAGTIKSGGITRRAAKMVVVDIDHPEILEFINWKRHEEKKARCLVQAGYSDGIEGEALKTVSGQNGNNSIRVSDAFMRCLERKQYWKLKNGKKIKAQKIWDEIITSAWECADPGVQFADNINNMNTVPNDGEIVSSNPCSEFVFIDDTACNLVSINLLKFLGEKNREFDLVEFEKTEFFLELRTFLLIMQDIRLKKLLIIVFNFGP